MKKLLVIAVLVLLFIFSWLHALGSGWLGGEAQSSRAVADGPRTVSDSTVAAPLILFGDLHTHTNFSLDAYLFNTELIKGVGSATVEDACDFARYCSALDFWSINDHAESLTPGAWKHTAEAVRRCNQRAGDPVHPDMVSFLGWEWSNTDLKNAVQHYGHKNVILRSSEEGEIPARPISSAPENLLARIPAFVVGLLGFVEELEFVSDMGWYLADSSATPECPVGTPVGKLPLACREVARTPADLYRKLDDWGFDSLVIPHGLSWGTTNPLDADFRNQLESYENRYERLIESYSGHGNSEEFRDFERVGTDANGTASCPPKTTAFLPCCRQAAELFRAGCASPDSAACEAGATDTMNEFARVGVQAGRDLFPDASLGDWAGCGQLQNSFQPASTYVPRQSAQYNLALGYDTNGKMARAKFGLIGSSDNHMARPGNSYKETSRLMYTDSKSFSGRQSFSWNRYPEAGSFYYTGGLIAVHSYGRNRDAIWEAMEARRVYATSGDRILLWFDLLNSPAGIAPMGSDLRLDDTPRFRVKALGALEQLPGCPAEASNALGPLGVKNLCGGECYRPGDYRKRIERIEIVRVRPQQSSTDEVGPLIENKWRVFECADVGQGCTVEFEDEQYLVDNRPSLYYARAIQEAQPLIGGDPFGCVYDDKGNCAQRDYCIGERATREENCLSLAHPRAWSSPIFIEPSRLEEGGSMVQTPAPE